MKLAVFDMANREMSRRRGEIVLEDRRGTLVNLRLQSEVTPTPSNSSSSYARVKEFGNPV